MEFSITETKQMFDAKAERVLSGLEQLLIKLDSMDEVLISQVLIDGSPIMKILKSCVDAADRYNSVNKNTFKIYDEYGYDKEGYDRMKFNCQGFNSAGLDRQGFDHYGFNQDGFDHLG